MLVGIGLGFWGACIMMHCLRILGSCKNTIKIEEVGSFLISVFGVVYLKGQKCVGVIYVTCQLFKSYFKLGAIITWSVAISNEVACIFDFKKFSKRKKVTYVYYTGHLEVCNESFTVVDDMLPYVCSFKSTLNKWI